MVKKVLMGIAVLLVLFMLISQGAASITPPGSFQPIVSTEWLEANLGRQNLVVLDVRDPTSYGNGHIPGAMNVPEADWYILDPAPPFNASLYMELPPDEDLFDLIGGAGITKNSLVVVVGSTSGLLLPEAPLALYNTAGITRVAITLLYAGVKRVAVLDGGYEKWEMEGKPTTDVPVTPTFVEYSGKVDKKMFVSIDYVEKKIGKSIIVDTRDEGAYCGWYTEPWCAYPGHIPTAVNLPTPNLWSITYDTYPVNATYITYKDVSTLKEMASNVVGRAKGIEIIVYCGVGGYTSTLHFVLSEVLGYNNVKFYDGSAQEWTHSGKPVETC